MIYFMGHLEGGVRVTEKVRHIKALDFFSERESAVSESTVYIGGVA